FQVVIESGAGVLAGISDEAYRKAGAEIAPDAATAYGSANVVLKVNAPTDAEIALIPEGATLISYIWPAKSPELLEALRARKVTTFAMDAVPRVSRAQKLDALSSMAN